MIDYKEDAFSLELLEWDRTFLAFGGSENSAGFKNGKVFTLLSLINVLFHFGMTFLEGLLKEIHTQKVVGIAKITYLPKSD